MTNLPANYSEPYVHGINHNPECIDNIQPPVVWQQSVNPVTNPIEAPTQSSVLLPVYPLPIQPICGFESMMFPVDQCSSLTVEGDWVSVFQSQSSFLESMIDGSLYSPDTPCYPTSLVIKRTSQSFDISQNGSYFNKYGSSHEISFTTSNHIVNTRRVKPRNITEYTKQTSGTVRSTKTVPESNSKVKGRS